MAIMRAIGLMSGTSLDGVDVALVETDGERIERLGPTGYRPYTDEEREILRAALVDAEQLVERGERPGSLPQAETLVTRVHAEAVEAFLAERDIAPESIDVVGFHGQTVVHRPDLRLTAQLGDGAALAARLGLPTVYDFRAGDIAAGGQGAPLVPAFHRALVEAAGLETPIAILNIGGVANVTLIGRDGHLLAFDTGPGNALIDDWMRERTGRPLDDGGRTAARGRPDEPLLAWLLVHPFFQRLPPKSLDRNWFSHKVAGHHSTENGAATLTAFTARAVARALDHAPEAPQRWIVSGGGARNGELLRLLSYHLRADITTADGVGWSSAFIEAQAFAFLAVRSLKGLALTFPTTTGCAAPTTGGVIAPAPRSVIPLAASAQPKRQAGGTTA